MRDESPAAIPTSVEATEWHNLEQLARHVAGLTFLETVAALPQLAVEMAFWQTYVAPLLEGDVSAQAALNRNVFVARTIGNQTSGAILQLFVWPPGSATQIHDHSCWGVLHCLSGAIREERYERLDDGAQMDVARLRLAWARSWSRSDGVTTVLPYEGGIHRVGNPGSEVAIQLWQERIPRDVKDWEGFVSGYLLVERANSRLRSLGFWKTEVALNQSAAWNQEQLAGFAGFLAAPAVVEVFEVVSTVLARQEA